jgi:hypothetical protein
MQSIRHGKEVREAEEIIGDMNGCVFHRTLRKRNPRFAKLCKAFAKVRQFALGNSGSVRFADSTLVEAK